MSTRRKRPGPVKNTVLWLHHFQELWVTPRPKEFKGFGKRLDEFIRWWKPDRIILTMFDQNELEELHLGIPALAHHPRLHVHEFGYAWEPDWESRLDDEIPEGFIEGGYHSKIIPIEDWTSHLKEAGRVALAGAFEGECLHDAEVVLRHLQAPYFKPNGLTV